METSKETTKERRLTSVCMTLNNYTQAEYDGIISQGGNTRYLIVAKEVGEQEGTPHLQMYCEFKTGGGKTQSAIKEYFKTNRLHIEARRGTGQQASDYCKFDDYPANTKENDHVVFGEMGVAGRRTDWEKVIDDVKNDKPLVDIFEENPAMVPYQRAIREVRSLFKPSIQRDNIRVIVLYGDAGTGKTRSAFEYDPDLYTKPKGEWWDGYTGEKTILLDDYYGYLSYSDLLRVLDRYKLQVPVKGGFVGARWDTVYITSNKSPSEWYSVGLTPALARRISTIHHLIKVGDTTEWFKLDDMNMETYEKTTDCVTGEQLRRGGGSLGTQG